MIIKINKITEIINRLKATAKNQPIELDEPPSILFTDNQVIAQGKSYMSIRLNHNLTDCLFNLENLTQIISKFNPENNINITKKDNENFIRILYKPVRREPTKIKLPIIESDHAISIIPSTLNPRASEIPTDLIKGMKICQHTLPPNTLKPEFNCFRIEPNNILVGGGIRLSLFQTKEKLCQDTFVISDTDGLIILSDKYNKYLVGDNSVEFWGEDIYTKIPTLDSKKNGPLIDINFMLKYDKVITAKSKSLIHDLETASIFATGSYDSEYAVIINIDGNQYLITSRNETGDIRSKGNLEKSDIKTTIKINPIYLMQALGLLNNDTIDIGISDFRNSKKLVMRENNFSFIMSTYIMENNNEEKIETKD